VTEPSKEALEMARELTWRSQGLPNLQAVAAALQKLMDERDHAYREREHLEKVAAADHERAEAAEAKLVECVQELRQWRARAYADGGNATTFAAILEKYEVKP
jgi:shikimate kinase